MHHAVAKTVGLFAVLSCLAHSALSQDDSPVERILITNVLVFDGLNPELIDGANVLVEGNPLDDITILASPEKNIRLIMKDGVVYKNTLPN